MIRDFSINPYVHEDSVCKGIRLFRILTILRFLNGTPPSLPLGRALSRPKSATEPAWAVSSHTGDGRSRKRVGS